MIHLIYVSSATSWPSAQDLTLLLAQSRSRNLRQNITGMLIYNNATYIQVLEGEPDDVHDIFASICRDPRNNGVVKLLDEDIAWRDFPEWSMGFKLLDAATDQASVPGFVDVFHGELDRLKLMGNQSVAIYMLLSFARMNR